MSETILYQFVFSHYCEVARWFLDKQDISYKLVNLVPVQHLFVTKRLGKKTYLPLLKYDGKILQGSNHIMDHFAHTTNNLLNHSLEEHQKKEKWLSKNIGDHLRRVLYFFILPDVKFCKDFITHDVSFGKKLFFKMSFPVIRKIMREGMNIKKEAAQKSQDAMERALSELNKELSLNQFLLGDRFSRTDIVCASLLAPLFLPENHPMQWTTLPDVVVKYRSKFLGSPVFDYVNRVYKNFR